nr:MAG TPA: PolyVal ADP-Ribosyltransferase [Crassvirales sp.]
MDIQAIFNAGGTVIKNPNYRKGKKNIEPEYITVSDLDSGVKPDGSIVADIAYDAAARGEQAILGRNGELDKYIEHGLTPNGWENLDSQLAEQQGAFSKFGNALAQTVVSELAIGTAKGFSDLFDLIGQGVGLADGDYSNPVSQLLEEKQEEFRNFAPIYSDQNLHISNGGLLDAGWWASNIPSIISSLTLLLPSSGIVKGASYVGKLGKVGSRTRNAVRAIIGVNRKMKKAEALRKAGKSAEEIAELTKLNGVQRFLTSASTAKQTSLFLENASTAALSRAMENYQEARQTYNDMYTEASEYLKDDDNYNAFIEQNKESLEKAGVDITDRDSVAKYVSSSAADRTFQIDWYNVGWDVLEMYGLRNAWKGLKNANGTPSAVRRAEKDAEKYFGKKPEEIAKLKSQRSFMEKAGEWASDKLYGSKLIIGSELSEGAEEALNYIATEEGMRFGRVLLGSEKGKNKGVWENIMNGFDGRLGSYLQAPALYDAAFWGVLGGVVFQAGGSALRRIGQKFEKSDADEKAKKSVPWYHLDELPENQRRISEIEARATDFATYKAQLDKINSGIDIYNSTKDNEVKFTSNEEAAVAREKLKDEFIASMTLRAMNTGNYDMLKAFLKNDNVRKNLIESGVFGKAEENGKSTSDIEAESKEYVDSAVRRMDEIANMYEQELTAIDYASSRIGNDVFAEYMQIMATNNVNTQLALRQNDLSLAGTNARIAQLEDQFRDKLDPSINHSNNIKVGLISSELGKLYAEKRNITKQEDSISKTISLENINKKIKSLEDELTNEELVFATSLALRYSKGEDGKYTTTDTSDYFEYRDKQIINRTEDMSGRTFESLTSLDLSDRARTILSDEELQKYNVLEQDAGSSFSALKQISPELNDLYAVRAATELSSKMLNSELVRTVDEVKSYANMLHNTMSEARVTAIDQANKTIISLYKKHGEDVENYISKRYRNESGNLETLSENERRDLDDALKVLALSKSYNKYLGMQLEMMFRQYDAIEASKDSADDNEQGEENTTNSEENTGTIVQDSNNTTETEIQANTEQETQQSDENQPTIDPQETENRTPAFYTKFRFSKGVLSSGHHSSTDNGSAAVYDNDDGTFTLDVRDNKRALNDSRFFSNAKEVDLTRPYEVVEKPILKKNKKGKLVIYKQGRLVNTDTLEYQAGQQEEQQISQSNERQNTETNGEQTTTQGINDGTEQNTETNTQPVEGNAESINDNVADNLSTGGMAEENSQTTTVAPQERQKSSTEITTSVYDDVIPDETTTEDEIRMSSLGRFQREFKANNDVDLDAIATEIINAEVKKGQDRQVVEGAVNKSLAIIKRVIERKKGKAPESTMKSSIDDVVVQSSVLELTKRNPFVEDYTNAVKNMINEFCKELGINEYNGKKYINLEDLLRYVNTISNDSQMSNMIFDALKVYLNTDETKTKFITTDENQNSDTLKKNIAKSAAQRYQERFSDTTVQRVNIWDLRNSLSSKKEIEEFEEAIEALNKGDKLTYTREDNKIVLKDTKGRTIGTLSIPRVNSKTGAYEMTNDGWKYDILTQSGGTINSNLKALFSHWLNEENDACKELNAIIYELAFEKTSPERKQELLAKFNENDEIKKAKAQGYVDNKVGSEKLINGLVKLWRYQSYTNGTINISRNRRIAISLNSWFSKLRNSYDGVSYLINNKDGEIEVANISDGEIIRASETNGQEAALPANKAIAGGVNPAVHKLAISSRTPNTLTVSGMPSINFSGVGKMNTFVLLPNRNGSYEYVQAYPADITDDYIGKEAKEIIKAIQNRVLELLEVHSSNPTQESFNDVKDFVKSVLSNYNGNSSLFWNLRLFEQGNTFGISLNNETKIVINAKDGNVDVSKSEYKPNTRGYRQKRMKLGTQQANEAVTEILNNLRFNLNPTYIASDNATNTILNGIAKRRNGKFEITIGDKTWSYDSYNAFVLNNNLVRLNTKPNERGTSNFNPRGSRTQSANQVLEIRINNATSSPVEGTTEEQQSVEPIVPNVKNVSIPEKALAILNGTQQSKHVGNDIAALVFNDKQLKALKDLELLPKNIIFDENFNNQQGYETINAEYNNKTKKITVGKRWLDMFNDPNTRNQAIRKLIHEQLHYKLRNDKGHVRSIQSIYNEFEEYLDKNNVPKDAHIRAYLFKNESTQLRALEEFLVESLTSEELAKYLNSIETSVPTKRGAKNLWQKILQTLSDIFGWNVTKGSLYEKELNTIRNLRLSSETVEQNIETQTDNSETNVEQEDNNGDNLQENNKTNEENNKTAEEKIEVQDEEAKETEESNDGFVDFSDDLIDEFDSSITEQPVSQTENTYTKEEQDILSRAPRNANGQLLAPNGNVSNLTEKQYVQVRTKAFKDWFGDWENSPNESSKVVDENGEPLVVYHNTNSKFTIFEKGHDFNKYLRSEEFTFHFGNKNTANNRTSKYSMPVFLNAKNTIIGYDGMQNSPIEFINELLKQNIIDRKGFDVARNKINDIQNNYNLSHKQRLEKISEYIDTLLEFYGKPNSVILYSNKIEGVGEDSYMVLNSNQIKSATDNTGAFSNKDDDIYHSSVTEERITLMPNVPSIASISDMLPLEQQPEFDALVASSEFETSCR